MCHQCIRKRSSPATPHLPYTHSQPGWTYQRTPAFGNRTWEHSYTLKVFFVLRNFYPPPFPNSFQKSIWHGIIQTILLSEPRWYYFSAFLGFNSRKPVATYSGASIMPSPLPSFQSPVLPVTSLCPSTSTTADKHPPWVKGPQPLPYSCRKAEKNWESLVAWTCPRTPQPPFFSLHFCDHHPSQGCGTHTHPSLTCNKQETSSTCNFRMLKG